MRTFAEKPKVTRQTIWAQPALPDRGRFEHNNEVNSMLHLQRTIGNQAAQRVLNRSTENATGQSTATGMPRLGYDFSRIPSVAAKSAPSARLSGSTALDADEQESPFIGNGNKGSKAPETAPATPTPAPAPSPAPATPGPAPAPPGPGPAAPGPAPAAPAPPAITSATAKAAPSGAANTRTQVGVGEVVDCTGSAAGTWAASTGTPGAGASANTFRWTAPATASTATITLTVGAQSATKTMTVVAPSTISMKNVGSHTSLVGAGGACMLCEVTFGPTDVCLGAIQWLEVPGPGTSVSGFFKKFSAATLTHGPNPNYALVNDSNIMEAGPNNGPHDHCAAHTLPGPYSVGAFEWVIPNRYIVDGEAAASGRHFTDTTQHFSMSAAGALTITKAGAHT